MFCRGPGGGIGDVCRVQLRGGVGLVQLQALSYWVGRRKKTGQEKEGGLFGECRRKGGKNGGRGADLEAVSLVLVRDEVGAREDDVVGEQRAVMVDVVAVGVHVLFELTTTFFELLHWHGDFVSFLGLIPRRLAL